MNSIHNGPERLVGPRLPDWRALVLDFSLRARMKRASLETTDAGLRAQARRFRQSMIGAPTPRSITIERTRAGGRPAEWVRDGNAGDRVVLFFHGGGFFMSSPEEHRPLTWRIARATGRRVLGIEYRKAPDYTFPAWLDDGLLAYRELLDRGHAPSDIVIAGDSAGGNIALAVTHRIRREGLAMPDGLILFSPWADMLCEGRSFRTNRRRDAMFSAASVRAVGRYLTRACDPHDPEISPARADFRGFPRMLLLAGSTEIFLDDSRTVAARAREAGVPVELYVYRHMPHVFPMFAGVLPRAKSAFDLVHQFSQK